MIGSDRHHCILTLVERKSYFAIIKKLESRTTVSVTQAALHAITDHLTRFKTITFDNCTELHGYQELDQLLLSRPRSGLQSIFTRGVSLATWPSP